MLKLLKKEPFNYTNNHVNCNTVINNLFNNMEVFGRLYKVYQTGDPNENNENYWKFSYDFKPTKKTDFSPDDPEFLRKKGLGTDLFSYYI